MTPAATTDALSPDLAEATETRFEERLEAEELAVAKAELEQTRAQLYGVLEGARVAFSAEDGIVRALEGAEQIDDVAESLLDVLCEALEFDVATFWLLDPEDGKLFSIAHRRAPTRRARFLEAAVRSLQLSLDEGIAGRVFVERTEFLSDDAPAASHESLASLLDADGLYTACAFMIAGSRAPLGVIEMERRAPLAPNHAINSAVRVIGDRIGAFIELSQMRWRYFSLVADLKRGAAKSSNETANPLKCAA